jgi:hypothetical protein
VPEIVLSTVDGLHVPLIPLLEVVGNVGAEPPLHIVSVVPNAKVGVIIGFIVTVNVALFAHCPLLGVKVYTPELVLLTVEGLHVPFIKLVEVLGNAGTDPPLQIDKLVPNVNVGVVRGITVIFKVAGIPHCPAVGVNV